MVSTLNEATSKTAIEQAKAILESLSPQRLQTVLALLTDLKEVESWEATAELDAIPGLREELERAEAAVARGETVRWEDVKDEL